MTEAAARLLADPAFAALKAFILEATGLVYYADRDEDLALRLQRRLECLSLPDCGSYFSHLRVPGSEEMDRLVAELTIGETYFFRHPEQFQALRQRALPDILERVRPTRHLRIWCAGCATGPEPYSLSILLRREMGLALAGWKISILGTDINKEFLAQARRARFPDWSLRGLDEDLRQACFRREGAEWVLDPAYCEGVFFQYHNLVRHPFPSVVEGLCAFDLIFCRNVMIYFDRQLCSRLVPQLERSLVEGGWLVVAPAELDGQLFASFQTVSEAGAFLYRKGGSPEPETPWVAPPLPTLPEPAGDLFEAASPGSPGQALPARAELPGTFQPGSAPQPWAREAADDLDVLRQLADRGRWEEAEGLCRRLAERRRLDPLVHLYRGLVAEQRGRPQEAEQALRQAVYLDRRGPLAHYHLGLLLQRQGRSAEARRSLRNVVEVLNGADPARVLPHADGLTCGDLKELARMQLEVEEL